MDVATQSQVELHTYQSESLQAQAYGLSDSLANFMFLKLQLGDTPTPAWYGVFRSTSIYGRNGTVIHWTGKQGRMLSDVSYSFQNGEWTVDNHPVFKEPRLPPFERLKGRATLLSCPYANNYFHFLFDSLPRLMLTGDEPRDRVIVNTERNFQSAYMRLFAIDTHKQIPVSRDTHYLPDELLIPSIPLPHLNKLGAVSPRTCSFLRTLLDHQEIRAVNRSGAKRFWIGRRNVRGVTNEDELSALLLEHDIQTIFLEDLNIPEQIALFRDAELVTGVHGAGFANLVYCRPGTPVIEILPTEWAWPFFHSLCREMRLNHQLLLAPSTPSTEDTPMRVDVPLDLLRHALSRV